MIDIVERARRWPPETDIEELVAEIERLRAEVERLEALGWPQGLNSAGRR